MWKGRGKEELHGGGYLLAEIILNKRLFRSQNKRFFNANRSGSDELRNLPMPKRGRARSSSSRRSLGDIMVDRASINDVILILRLKLALPA